jgi:hypothetical protein
VNAGGQAYTGADGRVWSADTAFSGGLVFAVGGSRRIAGTADEPLYRTERYGDFSYAVPVPSGRYAVTLKFAEIYWLRPDQRDARVFDVWIEGQRVLTGFNILAEVPANTALDKTFAVDVADGRLDVRFATIRDNAKVGAIEIGPVAP